MLTVLNVAFPLAPVGPDAVGGAEQVLAQIDRALVRAGARSLVLASEGSVTAGRLIATPPVPERIDAAAVGASQLAHRRAIETVLHRHAVDLIHLHGVDFASYLPSTGPPALITLHLPISFYAPGDLRPARKLTWFNCVSDSQRRSCPGDLDLLPTVVNGVPLDQLGELSDAPNRPRGYAIALGRICPEKGFHHALDAARAADIPLLLAGAVFGYPAHQDYFESAIRPRLDPWRRFIGPIGPRAKRRLLGGARCLLVPSLVPETGSLVAMEALACGTPVIAFPAGALAETVEHGRTGFLVRDSGEMAAAIREIDRIDRAVCRAEARRRFSAARMTDAYLALYDRVLAMAAAARLPVGG